MSENRSKGIVGIFILITSLFVIFLIFAFYTVSNLQDASKSSVSIDGKNAPIAVVDVEGVIMDSKDTIRKLLTAEKDKKIKAIILRVNSPGGAVGPTQEIYEEIRRIDKDVKPIYASFGTVAASGGYYIGAATRKIYSNAGALTGSIGVIMNFFDLSELYKWAKVNPEVVKAGKYKDIGSAARKMTTKERGLLNEMIENVHDQFIMDIFKVREKKIKGGLDGLKEYAQGQIFSGQGAMNRGLVDEIAGLWEAGRRIHKEMKLEGDFDLKFIKLKKDVSFFDIVRGLEESVENLNFKAKTELIPLLLYKPQV
ncbi:MAG: signal peptide peptidase SppA [Halobacteriovoraceae bacterium]|nr:signal peptide peptidase SppA [Halobacteriovoraceae bacterium]